MSSNKLLKNKMSKVFIFIAGFLLLTITSGHNQYWQLVPHPHIVPKGVAQNGLYFLVPPTVIYGGVFVIKKECDEKTDVTTKIMEIPTETTTTALQTDIF